DILIDLNGHTYGNRLLAMARKPAPLQFTYLGFAASTGMSAMDYRITDHEFDPPSLGDALYTEKLLRMPDSLWCYRPLGDFEELTDAPAGKNGYVTFASLNGFHKIHQALLEDWASLLQRVPQSRLLMVTVPDGKTRDRILDTFAAAGIARHRIELRGRLAPSAFRSLHRDCDIALDAFPCGGGATTCEVLWMGIPVISRKGETPVSRAGASLLGTVGLPDLVAQDRDAFFEIATTLAASPQRIASLRLGMRERMRASPLMQEARFTGSLEELYRQAWRDWCENNP
ncbi:MAG: peptide-binding protein, partial [Burkholderiales bacterium]